jgi:phospholipase C
MLPNQEPGERRARALPYELDVCGEVNTQGGTVALRFSNTGRAAAVFQVRSNDGQGPWTYTVGHGEQTSDCWNVLADGGNQYDLSVYAQNGFFRSFRGSVGSSDRANLRVQAVYDRSGGVRLEVENGGRMPVNLRIADAYTTEVVRRPLAASRKLAWHWSLAASHGWYDLTLTVESDPTFRQQLAGHVETGRDSMSDPLLGV